MLSLRSLLFVCLSWCAAVWTAPALPSNAAEPAQNESQPGAQAEVKPEAAPETKPDEKPEARHQITGLFNPERIPDLKRTIEKLPEIELVKVDFDSAEAVLRYDAAKAFPGATPMQIVERLDSLLKNASKHTFGAKPVCQTPREKLKFVEIGVSGLDCQACCLAAYEIVLRVEGVEQATASFKAGRVTAWIYPEKTSREKLAEALRQRGVSVDKE